MLPDLLRPRLLLSHLLVVVVVVACVMLGNWQFDRLEQVRATNALLEQRLAADPVDLDTLAGASVDVDALEYRRVVAIGVFRPEEEVLHRGRQHLGQPGFHVLTPLETSTGEVVLVRRGWVPASFDEPPVTQAAPPAGPVTVQGVLERSVAQPDVGPRDPEDGVLARVFHADTTRLDPQIDGALFPMVLRVDAAAPPPGELPIPPGSPQLDERNHWSYGMQWFSFALLALVTYGAWLWKRSRGGDDEPAGRAPTAPARVDVAG